MKWEKVAIKDVVDGIFDGPHATPPISVDGGVFLGISNITKDGHLDLSDIKYISKHDLKKWTKRVTPSKGDIVFSYEATLNLYAMIPEDFFGCLGRRMGLIRPNEDKAIGKFLYYYFFSPEWRRIIAENTVTGSTVDRIPLVKFPEFKIELPSLITQQRIASILSAYDDLIENHQKQIKLLEEAAQRLYKEWFVDLRFPGYENIKIVDGVPEGWNISKVSDVVSVLKRGISPRYNDDNGKYMVISQKCIRTAIVDYNLARKQDKEIKADMRLVDSDTVICSTGIGTLGRVGQVYGNHSLCTFDSHVTLVRANEMMSKQYLFHFLKNKQNYLMSMGRGSTQQQELYRVIIEDLDIIIPDTDVMDKFENAIQNIHDKINGLTKFIALLQEARDRLLPKLMNGELEV